ncbi:MAG TPA: alpha/beta hydrolase [Solirubrobacteraceae bacterium]|nr:alpha/beta hydrolase [Solirubrobacteraceae bacterium]
MTTFALVHGAWHGAWCWERLAPELERLGHEVLAVDLPCDDAAATFTTYADLVVRALEGEPEDVVVVGHSLGGLTIPLVVARRPVRRLVFLCALIAAPGKSFDEQFAAERGMLIPGHAAGLGERDEQGRRGWVDFELTRATLYADCTETDVRAAFERLRPQARAPHAEPCPLDALPDVERSYVVCADDRIVDPDWSRRAARERLGVEPVELPGSHSPFLSRPAELARAIA